MSKKKILFLINPVAGRKNNIDYASYIEKYIDETVFSHEIYRPVKKDEAIELLKQKADSFDIVVAVGGDGTVNEVINGCAGTQTILGIIPAGSGNGLAYTLGIPFSIKKAIQLINNYQENLQRIDLIRANDRFAVNQIGFGFDAHIANLFSTTKKRGLLKYAILSLKEYFKYKNKPFSFTANGKDYEAHAFVVNFSNNSQFGNNAHIAPLADLRDGNLEISTLAHFPKILLPVILIRLFRKTLHRSRFYKSFKAKTATIPFQEDVLLNMDGEHIGLTRDMDLKVLRQELEVIA